MPLYLKFSNSLETLARVLAKSSQPENNPFQKEYIVVSSTGLRKWLSLRLADRRGICANCEFPTPYTFIQFLLKEALGKEKQEDPAFSGERMTWRLYELLKASDNIPELKIPSTYLKDQPDLAALQLSQRVADLFDQYLTYRPGWIQAWDNDKRIEHAPNAARKHEEWQRYLWRQLNKKTGEGFHRASLYKELIRELFGKRVEALPENISIFGTHTLPPVFLEVLKALGEQHDVTLYLTQPTHKFWGDHPLKAGTNKRFKTETCASDKTDFFEEDWGNPLIKDFGGQGRDLFNVLIDANIFTSDEDDIKLFSKPDKHSILGQLKHSVYEIEREIGDAGLKPDSDPSLRIHCCHHPLREVEVLHDTLLNLFTDNRETNKLTPNDVLVLAPDIEEYAPLIDAVFGAPEKGIPEIPYSISDRSFRSASRIVESFYQILEFLQSRFKAPDFYALLQTPAFRAKFGWDDQDLSRIRKWMSEIGVAWGQDAGHRHSFDLPRFGEYSFNEMFEKIFRGYALGRNDDNPEIYDPVEGQDSNLIGQVAEAFERLRKAATELNMPLPACEWAEKLETCVVAPFLDDFRLDGSEVRQIRNGLEKLAKASENITTAVDLKTMAVFLEDIIEDGFPARGFMSRGVTFGRLTPMRAIPHKVVCLLGMQEGAFPRDPRPLGFDLMKIKGLVKTGDRAANQSDRYLFLETLLSAETHLHISYSGFSPRTDSISPPATPVGELLDFLHAAWPKTEDKASKLKSPFITEHRLHGHHPDYFAKKPIAGLLSFSKARFEAAMATREAKKIFEIDPLEARESTDDLKIDLDDFIRFFLDPAKHFCKNQLGISIPYDEEKLAENEPLEFNHLDTYKIFESIINREVFGKDESIDLKLPPGEYGKWLRNTVVNEAKETAIKLKERYAGSLDPDPENIEDIDLKLSAQSKKGSLTGIIPNVCHDRLICFKASDNLKPKDLIRGWILHLVLNASGHRKETVLIKKTANLTTNAYPPMEKDVAQAHLDTLFGYYLNSQTSPIAFEIECSAEWAKGKNPEDSMSRALGVWAPEKSYNPPGKNPWLHLCWRSQIPFEPPYTDEFAECAQAIFGPLYESKQ